MPTYTTLLQSPFDRISPEDDNFIEELLGVARLFRPFCEELDEFIAAHQAIRRETVFQLCFAFGLISMVRLNRK